MQRYQTEDEHRKAMRANRYVPTVPTNSHLFIVSWKILHTMHEFHASHAKFYKNMVCISKKWEQWEHPAQPA